jgi:nucleoside-diphosphate kinase
MNIKEFLVKFKSFTVQDFEHLTYAMIKPDAVVAKEEILQDIERRGFKILFQQEYQFSQELARNFYSEHDGKSFFERLIKQMTAGPVVVLILERVEGVPCFQIWRGTLGATNPEIATEGTLRNVYTYKLFGGPEAYKEEKATNCFHGADSVASVIRESNLVLYDIAMNS